MSSIQPSDIRFFAELAGCGSLSRAAQQLGVSVAAVSKRLAQIEARIGVVLLTRTGRKQTVTPEGELFLQQGLRILDSLDALHQSLGEGQDTPRGLLRVNASLGFGRAHVAAAVASFCDLHAEIDVRLTLTEAVASLADDSCDVCIRFGEPPDSRAIARRISDNERLICAAPAYLAAHPAPRVPAELSEHECIDIRDGAQAFGVWSFTSRGDPTLTERVRIRGRLASNDGSVALGWALAGRGLVMRSEWEAAEYLRRGELVRVLQDWCTPGAAIYAVYAQQQRASLRVRRFIEHFAGYVAAQNWGSLGRAE